MVTLSYRDVHIYRPYGDEVPWELLEGLVPEDADLDCMRVAKHGEQVVGAYLSTRTDPNTFTIEALIVDHPFRRCGIGRWLLGHALGVAESKGARAVRLACRPRGSGATLVRGGRLRAMRRHHGHAAHSRVSGYGCSDGSPAAATSRGPT